jgi:peptidoglycan/xylan/chitin deacetylase (PgdA/CDA1 family)
MKCSRGERSEASCYDRVPMAEGVSFGGKRQRLARGLLWSGATSLLSLLPDRDSLLVLNYHRIGDPDKDFFDPGVFSASGEDLDEQISHLKRSASLVTLAEALEIVGGVKETARRCRVLITFDDGYRDNYDIAYPILRSHGVQGVFFLATSMVGSCAVPWWDRIAWLMKTAQRRRFTLHYPAELQVDTDRNGMHESLQAVLKLYKKRENLDAARFMRELVEEAKGEEVPETERRFLSWDEAREMSRGGMAIGSHTESHAVLGQLTRQQQFEELSGSRAILKEELGVEVEVLAYPVGHRDSFSEETKRIAREAGYRGAFSHYGGTNLRGTTSAFDIKRTKAVRQSMSRFRVQTAVCRATGKFWP